MSILAKGIRGSLVSCLVGLGLLGLGCGVETAPSGPDGSALAPAAKSPVKSLNATSTSSGPTYAYYGTSTSRTVGGWIGSAGGWLRVADDGGTPSNSLVVEFEVPAGALDQPQLITMTVCGDLLSELVVEFQPGGLRFLKDATLTLRVGMNRVDIADQPIKIWHVYSDGTVEEVLQYGIRQQGNSTLTIAIPVSGFSLYGLRSR